MADVCLGPILTVSDLEEFGRERFEQYFRGFQVEVLCRGRKRGGFRISRDVYSPEPDIRVGPFATGDSYFRMEHDRMANYSREFIEVCISKHIENARAEDCAFAFPSFGSFYGHEAVNSNARCFIAVEIERKGSSRKHKLGSAINAIALGRIGIMVGFDPDVTKIFLRALKYLDFLTTVQKLSINFRNGLVLSKPQFEDILRELPEDYHQTDRSSSLPVWQS